MLTPFPPKTPMQMRLEAERRERPTKPLPVGQFNPAARTLRASEAESDAALDAAADWLAHLAAGRIEVR